MSAHKKKVKRILTLVVWIAVICVAFLICSISLRHYTPSSARLYATERETRIKLPLKDLTTPSPADILKLQQQELPNVPFEYWERIRSKRLYKYCARAPSNYELRFHNNYWQVFRNLNFTYHLFNAYFDARERASRSTAIVRLLAMMNQFPAPTNYIFCQLWYDAVSKPVIVPVVEQRPIWLMEWNAKGDYYPYLLSCVVPLPLRTLAPRAVSLVTRFCDTASNLVRVHNERSAGNETQHGFAVCVKGLDYQYADMGPRLVEWLEMQRLLGARKVITYKLALQPNLERVLQHYIAEGFLEVHPLSLGFDMVSAPHYLHDYLRASRWNKRLNELVPYNDCFYRNMYKYAYIAAVDIDEVILPLGNLSSWQQLIDIALRQRKERCPQFDYESVCVPKANFSGNERNPTGTKALQHMRDELLNVVTCFHNTSELLTLYSHYNIARSKNCYALELEPNAAQTLQYRLWEERAEGRSLIVEKSKDALMLKVRPILRKLGYRN